VKLTLETKEEQNRKETLMERFSEKLRRNILLKKCLRIWKSYGQEQRLEKTKELRMAEIYLRNLMKKSFYPWRT
jgi:hypothetical protein